MREALEQAPTTTEGVIRAGTGMGIGIMGLRIGGIHHGREHRRRRCADGLRV